MVLSAFSVNLIACAGKNESLKETPSSNANAQGTAAEYDGESQWTRRYQTEWRGG